MGSWSVYCGFSKITIAAGDRCVILPIKENKSYDSYLPHIPATLPIFGEYNDYGGIESIEKNDNTALIEKHYDISIEEFCEYLVDGEFTYGRKEAENIFKKHPRLEEAKNMRFMWINRNVYDFLSTYVEKGYGGAGSLDYGNSVILNLLGFKFHEKDESLERYKEIWEFQGKKFYSDGTWLNYNKQGIYGMYGKYSALSSIVDIPKNKKWLAKTASWQLWKYYPVKKQKNMLGWILGAEKKYDDYDDYEDLLEKLALELGKDIPQLSKKEPVTLVDKYLEKIEIFGDLFSDLCSIRFNLHAMSSTFEPYIKYLTPQCGEYQQHQVILNKFASINKKILSERGYDEED